MKRQIVLSVSSLVQKKTHLSVGFALTAMLIACDTPQTLTYERGILWSRNVSVYKDTSGQSPSISTVRLGTDVGYIRLSDKWYRVKVFEGAPVSIEGFVENAALEIRSDTLPQIQERFAWGTIRLFQDASLAAASGRSLKLRERFQVIQNNYSGVAAVVKEKLGPVFAYDTIGYVSSGHENVRTEQLPIFSGPCAGKMTEVMKIAGQPSDKNYYSSSSGYRTESWFYGSNPDMVTFRWYSGGVGCEMSTSIG